MMYATRLADFLQRCAAVASVILISSIIFWGNEFYLNKELKLRLLFLKFDFFNIKFTYISATCSLSLNKCRQFKYVPIF